MLWGFWNGLTAWIVFIVHVFGGWEQFPFYNAERSGNSYDLGFLVGRALRFWALEAEAEREAAPSTDFERRRNALTINMVHFAQAGAVRYIYALM